MEKNNINIFDTKKIEAKDVTEFDCDVKLKTVCEHVDKNYAYAFYNDFQGHLLSKNQIIIENMIIDNGWKIDTTNSTVFGITEDIDGYYGSRIFTNSLSKINLSNQTLDDDLLIAERGLIEYNQRNNKSYGTDLLLISINDGLAKIVNVGSLIGFVIRSNEINRIMNDGHGTMNIKNYFGQENKRVINSISKRVYKDDLIIFISNDTKNYINTITISDIIKEVREELSEKKYVKNTTEVEFLSKKISEKIKNERRFNNLFREDKDPYNFTFIIIKVLNGEQYENI